MNFVGSTFLTTEKHLALTFLLNRMKRDIGSIFQQSDCHQNKKMETGEVEIKVILFPFIIIFVIFPEYHFAEGRAIFDGSQGATLVLYPPDKRCAGDAGRPAPDNWGINSSGLSCKELSQQPTKISIPMRNTLSKDRFLYLRLFHSIIYKNCDKYFRMQFKLTNSSCADKDTLILFGQFSSQ